MGVRGNVSQKLGDGIGKKGAKWPSIFSIPLLDSKFNIDYDFFIKHDLIQ